MRSKLLMALGTVVLITVTAVFGPGCNGGGGSTNGGAGGGGGGGGGEGKTPPFVSIGTAPIGGMFYSVGSAISDALNKGKALGGWRKSTAESTGGTLENLRQLDSDDIQVGMANSSITYFAVRGEKGFDKKYKVQSIMTMFPLVAMFVTKKDSKIKSLADLVGRRVAVGPEGAGFEYFIRPILEEHKVDYDKLDKVYAGMQQSVGYLQDGSVVATFLGGGLKSAPAITSASSTMDIRLVPYSVDARRSVVEKYPSFDAVTVPAKSYKGQDTPFPSLNVGSAQLLVRSDANEEFVYVVTKIIYEAREKLAETHAAARAINPKNVVKDTGTSFHAGAVRFYTEIGIWPAANASTDEASGGKEQKPAAKGADSEAGKKG